MAMNKRVAEVASWVFGKFPLIHVMHEKIETKKKDLWVGLDNGKHENGEATMNSAFKLLHGKYFDPGLWTTDVRRGEQVPMNAARVLKELEIQKISSSVAGVVAV
jgi:hypothetical protein